MKFFHKRGGGSTGFHISYLEIHMYQKYGQFLNKNFIKAVRGGHRFVKLFHKIPLFYKGMLLLVSLLGKPKRAYESGQT